MPNEFDTNKNQLDLFSDSASKENQQDKRQRLASSGFTASVWTLSGVVLAACSIFDDGQGGGGNAVSVNASPVQGARVYFDIDGDGDVDADDVRIQNEQYPGGFVTGSDGRAVGIPAELFGRKYIADLNGAFDSATGQPLEGQVRSLEDEDGNHLIASPITDLINERAAASGNSVNENSVNEVVAEILNLPADPTQWTEDERAEHSQLLGELRNRDSYFPRTESADSSPGVIALSKYLADNQAKEVVGRGDTLNDQIAESRRIIAEVETGLAGSDAIVVLNEDTDTGAAGVQVEIEVGEHDSYVGIINAFAQNGSRLSYTLTETDGSEYTGVYTINARGGISFADGTITPVNAAETFNVVISNGNQADTQIVEVTITVDTAVYELDLAGREVGETDENILSTTTNPLVLIEGIEVDSTVTPSHFTIRDNALGVFADKFEVVAVTANPLEWNLQLQAGEWLDYEAIPGGEFELYISVRNDATAGMGEHSNILTVTIAVTDADDITFGGQTRARLVEDVDVSEANQLIAEGQVTIVNQDLGGSTLPVMLSSTLNSGLAAQVNGPLTGEQTIQLDYGIFTYDHTTNAWTYTVDNGAAAVQALVSGKSLTEVVTLTITDSANITYERSITLNILGTNEDVRFENANNVRVAVANVPDAMNIEIGDETALNGSFALGNVLTDLGVTLRGRLSNTETTTVTFADSVPTELRALFDLTEGGDLTFTGTSAQALSMLGVGTVELTLLVSTESTTLDIPLTVRVGVVNLRDNGPAEYEIRGDTGAVGNELMAVLTDPDGVSSISYQWYRGDDPTTRTLIQGANQATYEVTTADLDETLTVDITYTDNSAEHRAAGGSTVTAATTPVGFTSADTATVTEGNAANANVIQVQAESTNDDGSDAPITDYAFVVGNTLTDTDQGFTIDRTTGQITVDSALDYEAAGATLEFTLRVRATDTPDPNVQGDEAETGTQSITIRVVDANDNAPVFAQPSYTATIDETLAVGQSVGVTVAATDDDGTSANNQVTYSVTGGTGMGIFDVGNNGVITLVSAVDFESGTTSYTLEITATDNGSPAMMDTADVTITIRDINDESPTVPNHADTGTARITAAGDNPSGTSMGYTVTVSDADADATNSLDVSVSGGNDRFEFRRQGSTNTWELFLVAGEAITEAVGETIDLTYTVTDGGAPLTTPATGSFTLTVVDTPVSFTGPADRTIDLDEDTTAGNTVHFAVRATSEDDAGQSVGIASYMLLDDTDTATTTYRGFTIDSSSGDITLTGSLDHEDTHADGATITLRVQATDMNSPAETNTLTLTVNVGDVNDNAPVFSQSTYTPPAIDESLAVGAEVARVSATDADGTAANSQVAYSITAGNTGNAFSIDSNGVIRVANPLDFESGTTTYTLTITASDSVAGTRDDTATVTITVNDVNDVVPTYRVTAGENTATVRVTEAGGNSADVGTGYRITITDADTNNRFAGNFDVSDPRFDFVDQGSGVWELTLRSGQAVALSEGSLTITYQVNDGANTAAGDRGSVTVAVVDTTVSYTTTQTAPLEIEEGDSIDTNALGNNNDGVLAQVTAVSSENQPITYTLTSATGNDGSDASSLFRVDRDGEVRFVSSTVNLDYEAIEEYTLVITASAPQSSTTRETDEVPTNVVIRVTNREEGEATYVVSGNVQAGAELTVALASAADEDPDGVNGAVTYRWFERDSAAADPISLTDANSAITWLTTASTTNAVTLPSSLTAGAVYGVAISYEDGTGKTEFLVELASAFEFLDGTTVLTDSTYRPDPIAENTDSLLTVMPRLESKTTGFRYSFESGNEAGIFAIGTNGEITVATGEELDYEIGGEQHTLRVRVEEVGGDAVGFATVIITVSDVNDNDPVFTSGQTVTATIPESQKYEVSPGVLSAPILTITASDDDGTDANKDLTYSIVDGNTGNAFTIDEDSGAIRVADGVDLEYDATTANPTPTRQYTLMIGVSDGLDDAGDLDTSPDDTLEVTINIDDVNDSAPTVASVGPPGSLTEEAAGDANGGTETDFYVILNDADTNAVNQHDITIDDADLATRFDFVFDSANNRWNLVLLEGQKVDRETDGASLTIAYTITDGSNTPVTGNTAVVNITDINDNKPVVGQPRWQSASFENDGVREGVSITDEIFTMTATDADQNPSFTFDIVSIDGTAFGDITDPLFSIQRASGRVGITLGRTLDYETKSSHKIVLRVTDEGGNVSENTVEVTVNVQNVDEGDATYTISGETVNGGTLTATLGTADPDGVVAGSLKYRWFILNSDSSIPADGETNGNVGDAASLTLPSDVGTNVYGVVITYMDNAGEPETVTVIASPLRFASSAVSEAHDENSVSDTDTLATVTATLSTNTAAVPTYTLTDSANGKFEINAMGEISLASSETLDFENTPDLTDGSGNKGYVLKVDATTTDDAGKTENAPTATVTIIVNDVNDSDPTLSMPFKASDPNTVVTEDTISEDAPGASTLSFRVGDADTVLSGGLTELGFSITAVDSTNQAAVDIAAQFEMQYNSGTGVARLQLMSGETIDRESGGLDADGEIELNIQVTDGRTGGEGLSEVRTVTIAVTDVNDAVPVFANLPGTNADNSEREVTIREDAIAGDTVVAATPAPATDGDATSALQSLTYRFAGSDHGLFTIDPGTGQVTLSQALNYETAPMITGTTNRGYVLTILADGGMTPSNLPLTQTQELTIVVENVNEAPVLSASATAASINEGTGAAGGTRIGDITLTVNDPDLSDTATFTFDDPRFDAVRVMPDGNVWNLVLKSGETLNYEDTADQSISLGVSVTDAGGATSNTETITITVNDMDDVASTFGAFTWEGVATGMDDATRTVDENTVGTLATIALIDPDTADLASLTVEIQGGSPTDAGGTPIFTLTNNNGVATLAIDANAELDREAAASYSLVLEVSDGTNTPLDTHPITINVADVNESDPVVTMTPPTTTINEQTAPAGGTEIATFTIADTDASTSYDVVGVDVVLSGGNDRFEIADWDATAGTGAIRLKAGETLNFEDDDDKSITLTVTAHDPIHKDLSPVAGTTGEGTATVTITLTNENDIDPVVDATSVTWETDFTGGMVAEADYDAGRKIAQITATDGDRANDASFGELIYSLANTSTAGYDTYFEITPDGELRVKGNVDFDTLTTTTFDLVVQVNDDTAANGGGNTDTHTYTVTIGNENDNDPVLDAGSVAWESAFANGMVAEADYDTGSKIAQITATDGDRTNDASFGELIYSLANTSTAGYDTYFEITPGGELRVKGNVDFETITPKTFNLVVQVNDDTSANGGGRSHTYTYTVNIGNENDNNPVFVAENIAWNFVDINVRDVVGVDNTIEVFERVTVGGVTTGAAAGTVLATLSATDPDGGALSYSIDNNPQIGGEDVFEIVGNELRLKTELDHNVATSYGITLIAVDEGGRTASFPLSPDPMVPNEITIRVANTDEGKAKFAPLSIQSGGDLSAPVVGDTLTFNPVPTEADPDTVPNSDSFTTTWYREDPDGSNFQKIANPDDEYTLTADDVGKIVGVVVEYTDGGNTPHTGDQGVFVKLANVVASSFSADAASLRGTAYQHGPSIVDVSGTITYDDTGSAESKALVAAADTVAYAIKSGGESAHGTAAIDDTGRWTFNVDNTNTNVMALTAGNSLETTFTVEVSLTTGATTETYDQRVTVTIESPDVVSGSSQGAAGIDTIDRSTAATGYEIIQGGDESDIITAGAHGSLIIPGYGQDQVTLGDGVDTVVHRFASLDMGGWRMDDGSTTIRDFERGKDKFILIDTDAATPINRDTLIDEQVSGNPNNIATAPDSVGLLLIDRIATNTHVTGIKLQLKVSSKLDGPDGTANTAGATVEIYFKDPVPINAQTLSDLFGVGHEDAGGRTSGFLLVGSGFQDFRTIPNFFDDDGSKEHFDVIDLADFSLAIL